MAYPALTFNTFESDGVTPMSTTIVVNEEPESTSISHFVQFTQEHNTIDIYRNGNHYRTCIYVEDGSVFSSPTINVYLSESHDDPNTILRITDPDYIVYVSYPCSSRVGILSGVSEYGCNKHYIIIDGVEAECHFYILNLTNPLVYDVTFRVVQCEQTTVPGCCGSEQIDYEYTIVDGTIEKEDFTEYYSPSPNISFYLDCEPVEPIQTVDKFERDCVSSCNDGCDCDEIYSCRCIPKNFPITLNYYGQLYETLLGDCDNNIVELFVSNDNGENFVLLESNEATVITDLTPPTVTFEQEGKYILRVIATDCCGHSCSFDKTIIVGGSIRISKQNCPASFTINNYKNYNSNVNLTINVYNINNLTTPYKTFEVDNYDGTATNFSMNGEQGVWILELEEKDSNNVILKTTKFVINDFCKYHECYRNMMNTKYNSDCSNCDKSEQINNDLKIAEFQMLYDNLNMSVDLLMKKTNGLFTYDSMDHKWVKNISWFISKLNNLCTINNEPDSPCCNG